MDRLPFITSVVGIAVIAFVLCLFLFSGIFTSVALWLAATIIGTLALTGLALVAGPSALDRWSA